MSESHLKEELTQNIFSRLEAEKLAAECRMKLYRTSVKEDLNVGVVFQHLAENYVNQVREVVMMVVIVFHQTSKENINWVGQKKCHSDPTKPIMLMMKMILDLHLTSKVNSSTFYMQLLQSRSSRANEMMNPASLNIGGMATTRWSGGDDDVGSGDGGDGGDDDGGDDGDCNYDYYHHHQAAALPDLLWEDEANLFLQVNKTLQVFQNCLIVLDQALQYYGNSKSKILGVIL